MATKDDGVMRVFDGGATRDTSGGKNDYGGFLSPEVLIAFGDFMRRHQVQPDGSIRDPGNWKHGMPTRVCLESGMRHWIDIWMELDGNESREGMDEALGGAFFNIMALWYNLIQEAKK